MLHISYYRLQRRSSTFAGGLYCANYDPIATVGKMLVLYGHAVLHMRLVENFLNDLTRLEPSKNINE